VLVDERCPHVVLQPTVVGGGHHDFERRPQGVMNGHWASTKTELCAAIARDSLITPRDRGEEGGGTQDGHRVDRCADHRFSLTVAFTRAALRRRDKRQERWSTGGSGKASDSRSYASENARLQFVELMADECQHSRTYPRTIARTQSCQPEI